MVLKVGFIINPIAGLGGKLAWKGTDLLNEAWQIYEKGEQYSYNRIKTVLKQLPQTLPIHFFYCGEPMGQQVIESLPFSKTMAYRPHQKRTSAEDTKNACKRFLEHNIDLLIFVGGDGTARDIADIVQQKVPIVGVPSGVKMFSGCFLHYPQDLICMLKALINNEVEFSPEDILDVDETAFRKNQVKAKIYNQVLVPHFSSIIQGSKMSSSLSTIQSFEPIAFELKDEYEIMKGVVVLGTGSTIYYVFKHLGIEKTLLGVDIMIDGKIVAKDVNEKQLLEFTKNKAVKVVLTPIGGQGFILGRGNQQISARVINNWKNCEMIVISAPKKIASIKTLYIDVDETIVNPCIKKRYIRILIGYHEYLLKKLKIAES